MCAVDGDGMVAAVVMNHATGEVFSATRGEGASRDGLPVQPSAVRKVEDAMVGLSGWPARLLPWQQYRALGCASLALCSIAAGGPAAYTHAAPRPPPRDFPRRLLLFPQ